MTATSTTPGSGFEDVTSSEASLRRFLHGLPGVDQVGADARAAGLGTRSIKTSAKAYALDLAIRMVDLTTLEGQDTPGRPCRKRRSDASDRVTSSKPEPCAWPGVVEVAVTDPA